MRLLMVRTFVRKISRVCYFCILFLGFGYITPRPETYIYDKYIDKISLFFYGVVSADSMYDIYFYIAFSVVLFLTVSAYILTVKLIKKNIRDIQVK